MRAALLAAALAPLLLAACSRAPAVVDLSRTGTPWTSSARPPAPDADSAVPSRAVAPR